MRGEPLEQPVTGNSLSCFLQGRRAQGLWLLPGPRDPVRRTNQGLCWTWAGGRCHCSPCPAPRPGSLKGTSVPTHTTAGGAQFCPAGTKSSEQTSRLRATEVSPGWSPALARAQRTPPAAGPSPPEDKDPGHAHPRWLLASFSKAPPQTGTPRWQLQHPQNPSPFHQGAPVTAAAHPTAPPAHWLGTLVSLQRTHGGH